MTSRLFALAACTTVLAVASSSTLAQEATLFPHEMRALYGVTEAAAEPEAEPQRIVITGRRLTTRQRVVADLQDAIRDGTLDRSGEAQQVALSDGSFLFTRAEVVAELMKAKAEGRFDTSGEHWIGHDNGGQDPSYTVASKGPSSIVASTGQRTLIAKAVRR